VWLNQASIEIVAIEDQLVRHPNRFGVSRLASPDLLDLRRIPSKRTISYPADFMRHGEPTWKLHQLTVSGVKRCQAATIRDGVQMSSAINDRSPTSLPALFVPRPNRHKP
jgi:hypothetical protein